MPNNTSKEWEKELGITDQDIRKTINVDKLRKVIESLLLKQKQEIRESTIKECIKVAMNSRAIFFGTKDSLEPPADEQLSELKAEIVTNMQRLLLSDTEEK